MRRYSIIEYKRRWVIQFGDINDVVSLSKENWKNKRFIDWLRRIGSFVRRIGNREEYEV